jgi:tetratricopeptide (TPR) repeat protein
MRGNGTLPRMDGYRVARLEEIDELDDGRIPWRPIRHHLGIMAFGANAWTGKAAGDRIINEHDESDFGEEELYIVFQGRATFELDGEQVDAPTGTFVAVPPGVNRTAFAVEAGTTIVAVGAVPGKPYAGAGWELWAPIRPLYMEGRYAEAADAALELAEANPEYAGLQYNLACCESLCGRTDAAIGHLGRAIELWEGFREYAAGDSDFDALREEPAFAALLAAP